MQEGELIDISFDEVDTDYQLPQSAYCPECGDKLKEIIETDENVHMIFVTSICDGCGYTATER